MYHLDSLCIREWVKIDDIISVCFWDWSEIDYFSVFEGTFQDICYFSLLMGLVQKIDWMLFFTVYMMTKCISP